MNKNDKHLIHYASKYYDPVKAHEYYMKNRELKGRRLSSKLTEEGKTIWSHTKQNITDEKKEKIEAEKNNRDKKIEELRVKATETRNRISSRLKELNEILTERASKHKESIEKNKDKRIDTLTKTAKNKKEKITSRKDASIKQLQLALKRKNLSDEQKEVIYEKMDKLRSDAKDDISEVNDKTSDKKSEAREKSQTMKDNITRDTRKQKTENSDKSRDEKAKVSAELKSSIEAVRSAYKKAKTSLDSSYEEIFQKEYNNILSSYAKKKKTKGKKENNGKS